MALTPVSGRAGIMLVKLHGCRTEPGANTNPELGPGFSLRTSAGDEDEKEGRC